MTFNVCNKDCPLHAGFLGLISKGYYPSSPVQPRFVFHQDVIILFHEMYMRGPSSKLVYTSVLRACIQRKTNDQVRSSPLKYV